ncbi:hypothetical protein SAMN04487821_10898 [Enterococcus malodoratus]|uniref:Uncharacterized protein n=1 Tax=Enterococcus malodoratus ATCC 43197 TaxID=1158601 RepID=R2R8F8_9ENTE|nr:hypothetical protein UAI_03843 [Enterococcus malodoratus ATCC 43197]OJG64221.1 hypothetical protein RV07_GL000366 [Enterococcus malodoratus]EOT70416.1 hypothetical protein I585_01896 [Enterococcus malodoratus ATCC 43197]SET23755.1 hypothetical protein SAMN04487821_10898 [Enterococcus malodoratus]SPW69582.1 Uncharacterised protein [Enterococcus malodoratus]
MMDVLLFVIFLKEWEVMVLYDLPAAGLFPAYDNLNLKGR